MASFSVDTLDCKECGCDEFEQKELVTIKSEADKYIRYDEPYPQRFIDKRVVYLCTKCGREL